MDNIKRLEIIEEAKRLKARYFYHLDHKEWDSWREVFAQDAVLDTSGHFADAPDPSLYVMRGSDAIVQGVATHLGETVTVHHGHSPIIDVKSETEASGIWAMEDNLFMPDGSRMLGYGHYHEQYRLIDGSWRISHSRLTRLKLVNFPA